MPSTTDYPDAISVSPGRPPPKNVIPPSHIDVKLVKSVKVPPRSSIIVPVHVNGIDGDALLEPTTACKAVIEGSLIHPVEGMSQIVMTNQSFTMQYLKQGAKMCEAVPVEVVDGIQSPESTEVESTRTYRVLSNERVRWRKQTLLDILVNEKVSVPEEDRAKLCELLFKYHDVFTLEEGERGETDLIEFSIDTGDAPPIRHPL